MGPDPTTQATRLRENEAEANLAILRNRVEQHLTSVGKTPDSLIDRSQAAVVAIEKIISQLQDCANGRNDLDLKVLVGELDDNFRVMRARQRWHDQQVTAFAPLRAALDDTEMPETPDQEGPNLSEYPRCANGNSYRYHDRPCGPGCDYPQHG